MEKVHTSNLEQFKQQLAGEKSDIEIPLTDRKVFEVVKNIVVTIPASYAGVGHIRTIFPSNYLNAVFGKSNKLQTIVSPFFPTQKDILLRTKAIWFQRVMNPKHVDIIEQYRQKKDALKIKMVYDIDDFIWKGDREGECIPEYNNGREGVTDEIRSASVEIMKRMDLITVSSQFLGDYITNTLNVDVPIRLLENRVFKAFWGDQRKSPIVKKIEKPKIIWTASPTHWSDRLGLKGDIDNAWCEYVLKNVKDGKIQFFNMGCNKVPFYFKELEGHKDYFIVPWTNSYLYHLPVKKINADFSIGPLVPNFFNYSKSCIKMQESYANGSAFIGTTFTNGYTSPYDNSFLTLKDNCTVKDIEDMIDEYSEPEKYNEIITKQYDAMKDNDWYYESAGYIKQLLDCLS